MKRKLFFIFKIVLAIVVVLFMCNLVIYFRTEQYIYENAKDAPSVEVALIPGAAVFSKGSLSPIFEDRVNKAIELYNAKKVSKILVSGDNSTTSHNEVNPVRNYLLKNGVPDEDIFLDHAGFDTYSSMYRARDIFQVDSIIISTQSFHLPRAVFIARVLGMNAYGISADNGNVKINNYVREFFANEKAMFDLLINRKPKFLGDAIPIVGENN